MLSFNPLFSNDFFNQRPGVRHAYGHHSGHMQHHGRHHQPVAVQSNISIQESLNIAYQKMQAVVSSRLSTSPTTDASTTTEPTPDINDFSPQAVADRVVGFIAQRLQQEKANGASDEELQNLFQQGLKGVEQGLREGREIIQGQGLFDGEVKDNFYSTVNLVADGLEQLGQELFGSEAPQESIFAASSSEVFVSQRRSFEMEVITQDGDRVTLLVNSGQQYSSKNLEFNSDDVSLSSSEENFISFDNLAFSVEGDLDESEMSALSELFSQVNDVAGVFYGGDVEQAFDQAMNVGMNSEELAAFTVNMNQSETVAMKDAYVSVENMAGPVRHNPMEDMMSRLGSFADKIAQAKEQLAQLQSQAFDLGGLFGDVVGNLHSNSQSQPNSHPFNDFVHRLA